MTEKCDCERVKAELALERQVSEGRMRAIDRLERQVYVLSAQTREVAARRAAEASVALDGDTYVIDKEDAGEPDGG